MFHVYNYLLQLLETDKHRLEQAKWVGNGLIYLAACVVAISVTAAQSPWPFAFYLVGSAVWLMAAKIMRDRPLFWMQVFFIFVNGYAIWLRV